MKKLVSTILTLALVCAIFPWSALQVQAEEPATTTPPTVKINGVELPDGKYFHSNGTETQESAPATGGYAHLSSSTLTLSDFTLNATTTTAIEIRGGDCTINMTGNSTVKGGDATSDSSYGILANGGNLTFEGNGTLTAKGGSAKGESYGVCLSHDTSPRSVNVSGTGQLEAIGGDATGTDGVSYGVSADTVNVNDSGKALPRAAQAATATACTRTMKQVRSMSLSVTQVLLLVWVR